MPQKLEKFQVEELEQRFEMGWSLKKVDYKLKTPEGTTGGTIYEA